MLKLEKLLTGVALTAVLAVSNIQSGLAGFDEAVTAYEAKDYKTAFDEWLPLAKSNDPAAMRNLGHLYRRGFGVEQDFKKALSWYLQAAEMGFDRAQANVATMYLKGEGVEQNFEVASTWFSRAARNGHTIAQYNLGLMYEHGKGVEKSASKALGWYNLAAKAGHKQALDKLSILIARDPKTTEERPTLKAVEPVVVANAKPKADVSVPQKKAATLAPVAKPKAVVSVPQKKATTVAPVAKPKAVVSVPQKKAATVAPVAKPKAVVSVPQKKATTLAPVAKPKAVVSVPQKKAATLAPVAKPKPATVTQVEPVMKKIEGPKKPHVSSVTPAPVSGASTPKTKKWDPFAGSANNILLKGEKSAKGEATVFSKPAPKPALSASKPAENSEPVASSEKQLKRAEPTDNKEKKGFFAALKSLITGEEKDAVDTEKNAVVSKSSEPEKARKQGVESPTAPRAPVVAVAKPVVAPKPVAASKPVLAVKPVVAPKPANIPEKTRSSLITNGAGLTLGEQLEMAGLAFTLEEYQQALNVWAPLAQKGNAEAQFNLGNMFLGGHAVPVDRVRAYYWWEKAKNNGSSKAASSLAKLEKSLTFLEKRQLQQAK